MIAQLRNVRFISADSCSHASRSSPSMSCANRSSSENAAARHRRADVAERPHGDRIIVGDKAQRLQARALHAARQQHAERLMREAPFERIGDREKPAASRECLDEEVVFARQFGALLLQHKPFADLIGQVLPVHRDPTGDAAHPCGEIGRERKLAARIGRHARRIGVRARHQRLVLDDALQAREFRRRTETCRAATSVSRKNSSISPSTRPPRETLPV